MNIEKEITTIIEREFQSLFNIYCWFHSNPELSNHEENTARTLCNELKTCGFEVIENIGGSGIVGIFKNGSGPTVIVRTELDALPILEETDLSFRSQKFQLIDHKSFPVMHACGHDLHLACSVGVARICTELRQYWSGTLIVIGEPSEETGSGARAMVLDNLFSKIPKPDYSFALHVDPDIFSGKVGFIHGTVSIGREIVTIKTVPIKDWNSFSFPQNNSFFSKIQLVLSREFQKSVQFLQLILLKCAIFCFQLQIKKIVRKYLNGENYFDIVSQIHYSRFFDPFEMVMIFCYSDKVAKENFLKDLNDSLDQYLALFKLCNVFSGVVVRNEASISPIINDSDLTHFAKKLGIQRLGNENVVTVFYLFGVDDYSVFLEHGMKNCFFKLGSGFHYRTKNFPLHSNRFNPDTEPALKTGIDAMSYILLKTFQERP